MSVYTLYVRMNAAADNNPRDVILTYLYFRGIVKKHRQYTDVLLL